MPYRLRIDGDDGLSVDRVVAKELVLRMLQLDEWVLGITSTKATGADSGATELGSNEQADPRAFLLDSKASTNMAKIATLGIFLSLGGKRLFGPTEIRDLLMHCGERPPANLGRDFKETERLRWIARDTKQRGQWFVTNDARRALEGGFALESSPRSAPSRSSLSKKPQAASMPMETNSPRTTIRAPENPSESATPKQSTGIGNGITATGPMAVIDRLCAERFFSEWRSTADIIEESVRLGFTLTRTDTTSLLPKYIRKRKLVREKRSPDGGSRPVWHYTYPTNA